MSKFYAFIFALIQLFFMQSASVCAYTDTPSEAIDLNNRGVLALNESDYPRAIEIFESAMKIAPNYQIVRRNYSIALNNYGLANQLERQKALELFERALYFDFDNITTQHNSDGIIRMMSLDPHDPLIRIGLGSKAIARGDLIGAVTEFKIASQLCTSNNSKNLDEDCSKTKTDYSDYIQEVQRKIKKVWYPTLSTKIERVILEFEINRKGEASNFKVLKTSNPNQTAIAIRAVENASPFGPLPKNILLQFTFDYNKNQSELLNNIRARDRSSSNTSPEAIELQSQLAEKQILGEDLAGMLDLKVRLVTIYINLGNTEMAKFLLDDSLATYPGNKKLLTLDEQLNSSKLEKNEKKNDKNF